MQPIGKFIFVHLTGGHSHHGSIVFIFWHCWHQTIELEKCEHCHARGTFVAINKWVVPTEVKSIRGNHRNDASLRYLIVSSL